MTMQTRFLLDTASRIGSSIFAGSLVSCLVEQRIEILHIALMILGVILTALAYPTVQSKNE